MMIRLLAFVLLASSWFAAPAQAVVLGVSGSQLTFDGTPTKLVCTSYFNAVNYKTSDLNYLANKGYNCLRAFANWPAATGGPINLYDDVVKDGSLNATTATALSNFIDAANALGMIVNLTLSYDALNVDLDTQGKRTTYITNAINQFEAKTNVYYDLVNERDLSTWADSAAEIDIYYDTARAACTGCLLTASNAHYFQYTSIGGADVTSDETLAGTTLEDDINNSNLNIISAHLPRTSDWDTKTASRIGTIATKRSLLGKTQPIVLDEEQRVGYNSAPAAPANFFLAAQQAISAGAAGCQFHTDAGFDLAGGATFIGNLTADELTVVNGLSAALVPSVSPISISAVCPKVSVDAGLSATCTLPQTPVAGDVVFATVNTGQFDGVQACLNNTGGSSGNGVKDSQNGFFDLAVMSPVQTTNSSSIWFHPITVAPSGSYSVTMTCPVATWMTMSAAIVKGIVPSLGMVDVVGFNTAPAGSGLTVNGSTAMTQANELIIAVETHDVSGAGTAITETSGYSVFHEQETCSPSFGGHECGSSVYKIVTLPQTVTHSWTMAASVNSLSAAIATFRGITGNVGTINRTLTWTDNSSNEASYTVQKRTDQTYPTWVDVATGLQPNTQSYLATILETETGDCWRVAAVNSYGTALSINPSEFCVATAPPPPPPPPPALQIGGLQTLMDDELL